MSKNIYRAVDVKKVSFGKIVDLVRNLSIVVGIDVAKRVGVRERHFNSVAQ